MPTQPLFWPNLTVFEDPSVRSQETHVPPSGLGSFCAVFSWPVACLLCILPCERRWWDPEASRSLAVTPILCSTAQRTRWTPAPGTCPALGAARWDLWPPVLPCDHPHPQPAVGRQLCPPLRVLPPVHGPRLRPLLLKTFCLLLSPR